LTSDALQLMQLQLQQSTTQKILIHLVRLFIPSTLTSFLIYQDASNVEFYGVLFLSIKNILANNVKWTTHFIQVVINVSLSMEIFTSKRLCKY